MISVLILCCRKPGERPAAPGDVVKTLAPLVSATIEGVVRDVLVLARGDDPALRQVVDHAGCGLVEAPSFADLVRQGASRARCSLVLVIEAGTVVGTALIAEIADLLAILAGDSRDATFVAKAAAASFPQRLFPVLAPNAAVLTARARLAEARADTFGELARQIRPARRFRATVSG